MRNLLAFLALVLIVLIGVGWYEDWFQFKTKTGANGDTNISIDVDATKAAGDITKAEHSIEDKIKEAKKDSAAPATPPKDKPAPAIEVKDSPKDPKVELNLFGQPNKKP